MKRMTMLAALALVAVLVMWPARTALAHGHVEVGEYELVIGFVSEPAYQGEPNGLDLRVSNHATKEPINDLADTLKAEIIYGSSKREVQLRPRFGVEGGYTANVLPTAAGDYTWHIWGEIKGTPVDISMTSGEGRFNAVQAKDVVSFPAPEPTAAELKSQVDAAEASASRAMMVGIGGAVLGLLGLGMGLLGRRQTVASSVRA